MIKIRRALISAYYKDGLEPLLKTLHDRGCTFVSTGGTAKFITDCGYPCDTVEELTGFAPILDGRVKTLHPKVFGGILTRGTPEDAKQLREQGIEAFQLVIVNLYPFDESPTTELIDIGGVSLIRAAAKNCDQCVVLAEPSQYAELVELLQKHDGAVPKTDSLRFSAAAFACTSRYDASIAAYRAQAAGLKGADSFPERLEVGLQKIQDLSYGENPHQKAAVYSDGAALPRQLAGKPLSYNNLVDLDGCIGVLRDYADLCACVILKHSNPCGIGIDNASSLQAYERALAGDPTSAFGGIVGFSRRVDVAVAQALSQKFYEIIIAPDYEPQALEILQKKPKLRLMQAQLTWSRGSKAPLNLRQTLCGFLLQEQDTSIEVLQEAAVPTKRRPDAAELRALLMAWRACKWVKSNAIVIANEQQTVGIGAGQMSRIDAVELAIRKAQLPLAGCVLASDAFFPFRDGVDLTHKAGIRAIVQPGGSIRDAEVIAAADEHGIAMVFTGKRHFRH